MIFKELYYRCSHGARKSKGLTAADRFPSQASGSNALSGFPRAGNLHFSQSFTPVKSCGRKNKQLCGEGQKMLGP